MRLIMPAALILGFLLACSVPFLALAALGYYVGTN